MPLAHCADANKSLEAVSQICCTFITSGTGNGVTNLNSKLDGIISGPSKSTTAVWGGSLSGGGEFGFDVGLIVVFKFEMALKCVQQ